jgi:hypothetical protein
MSEELAAASAVEEENAQSSKGILVNTKVQARNLQKLNTKPYDILQNIISH